MMPSADLAHGLGRWVGPWREEQGREGSRTAGWARPQVSHSQRLVGGEWAELILTWFLRHGEPGLVQERAPLSGKVWTPRQASVSLFLPLERHWRKQVCA